MKTTALPSIRQLIKESWETTKGSWWGMVRVWILTFGVQVILFLVGLVVVMVLGVQGNILNALTSSDTTALGSFVQNFGLPLAVIAIIWLVASIVISLVGQVAALRMVYDYEEKPSARDMFKDSFRFVGPLVILAIVGCFIILGGFFALIIPGIIFSLLFAFSTMELAFNKQTPIGALKRSVSLVSSHFGDVLLRWIVLFVMGIAISIIFSILGDTRNDSVQGVVTLLSMVVNYAMMFFSFAYGVTLYRHLVKAGVKKESSLMWILIVSAIGWLIGGFIIMSVAAWAKSEAAQNLFNSMGKSEEELMIDDWDDETLEEDFMQLEKDLNETTGAVPAKTGTGSY